MQPVKNLSYRERRILERQKATKEFLELLKPGVILYDCWGYEQTNVEFAKVLDRKGNKVLIKQLGCRSIRSTGWASDVVVAGDELQTPAWWIIVRGPRVKISDCVSLTIWDGSEMHRSWYA